MLRALLVVLVAVAAACAPRPQGIAALSPIPTPTPTATPTPTPTPTTEMPERDPAACGVRVGFRGDLPDDRDGDGVPDVFEMCPDPPADRLDGCVARR